MIHIAHQTLSDLNRISPDFAGQVLGNCNVRFIFRQDDPDDAERWARFIGTRLVTKRTYQTDDGVSTGKSSNRDVLEFVITPDQIKGLLVGEAAFSIKSERVVKLVRTTMNSPIPVVDRKPNRSVLHRGLGEPVIRATEEQLPAPESLNVHEKNPPKEECWALVEGEKV